MEIMRYVVRNEAKHPWREAIKTQIPTVIITTLMMLSYLIGVYVGEHQSSCCDRPPIEMESK